MRAEVFRCASRPYSYRLAARVAECTGCAIQFRQRRHESVCFRPSLASLIGDDDRLCFCEVGQKPECVDRPIDHRFQFGLFVLAK